MIVPSSSIAIPRAVLSGTVFHQAQRSRLKFLADRVRGYREVAWPLGYTKVREHSWWDLPINILSIRYPLDHDEFDLISDLIDYTIDPHSDPIEIEAT